VPAILLRGLGPIISAPPCCKEGTIFGCSKR